MDSLLEALDQWSNPVRVEWICFIVVECMGVKIDTMEMWLYFCRERCRRFENCNHVY